MIYSFFRGIARIKHLKLRETGLTVDQINLLMIEIIDGDNIKSLDIIDKNISQANVQNMIEAFNSLDSLSLHYGTIIGKSMLIMLSLPLLLLPTASTRLRVILTLLYQYK